jgi:hypothetical protein
VALSSALAQVLAAGRAQFNARVVEAKHRYPTLDTAAFSAFLQGPVDQLVTGVAAVAPDRTSTVALVAYELGLELVGQALAGPAARSGVVNRAWAHVAPRCVRLLAAQPLEVLGALTNAGLNVEKTPSARTDEWLQLMGDHAGGIETVAQLRSLGQIAAWRAGLAHFREGALHAADALPEPVAVGVVGAPGSRWTDVKAHILADPWWLPAKGQRSTQRLEWGRFVGFGGSLPRPPEVRACAEGFFTKSGDRYGLLVADIFGGTFHSAAKEDFDRSPAILGNDDAPRIKGTSVVLPHGRVDLDLPADGLAMSCNAHTVAITSPYTFAIRLLPRQ